MSGAQGLVRADRVTCWVGVTHTNWVTTDLVAGAKIVSLDIVSAGSGWRQVVVVLVLMFVLAL